MVILLALLTWNKSCELEMVAFYCYSPHNNKYRIGPCYAVASISKRENADCGTYPTM
jgi:hypothetical protein